MYYMTIKDNHAELYFSKNDVEKVTSQYYTVIDEGEALKVLGSHQVDSYGEGFLFVKTTFGTRMFFSSHNANMEWLSEKRDENWVRAYRGNKLVKEANAPGEIGLFRTIGSTEYWYGTKSALIKKQNRELSKKKHGICMLNEDRLELVIRY